MSLFSTINTPSEFLSSKSWFTNKFLVNYGYIPDGPGVDLKFSQSPLTTTPISTSPSLKDYFKPVSDQYSIGSCVANAVADSFEAQLAHRRQCSPSTVDDISRLFIYWNARNLENPPTYNVDKGSRIRLAFDCMARYGAPSEKIYPYDVSKVNERPTIIAYREAIKNRISKFYRIDGEGAVRVGQIKQALSGGNPVVFGTKVAESFKWVNSDAIVYNPGGGWIGGHAMVIVGWSESKQAFEVRNSWGTGWGVNGYCWMDKNYIASSITSDIWAATV
jgi:C1A family cysteine protease